MYSNRIQYALDHFFLEDYFSPENTEYTLEESDDMGKTSLLVNITGTNLCIANFDDKKRCEFVKIDSKEGMRKCSDHIVFQQVENDWRLIIIEMKSSISDNTWKNVKQKTRATYLNAAAIAAFLGIEIGSVQVYTTYERETFGLIGDTTELATYKVPLGTMSRSLKNDEWDKNRIGYTVDGTVEYFPHQAIKVHRNSETNILEGSLAI